MVAKQRVRGALDRCRNCSETAPSPLLSSKGLRVFRGADCSRKAMFFPLAFPSPLPALSLDNIDHAEVCELSLNICRLYRPYLLISKNIAGRIHFLEISKKVSIGIYFATARIYPHLSVSILAKQGRI